MEKGYSLVRAQKRWVVPLVKLKRERLFPWLSLKEKDYSLG
jgi:hypothetical protein